MIVELLPLLLGVYKRLQVRRRVCAFQDALPGVREVELDVLRDQRFVLFAELRLRRRSEREAVQSLQLSYLPEQVSDHRIGLFSVFEAKEI